MKEGAYIVVCCLCFFIGIFADSRLNDTNGISVKKKITPKLFIKIENGITDTTFIYKK